MEGDIYHVQQQGGYVPAKGIHSSERVAGGDSSGSSAVINIHTKIGNGVEIRPANYTFRVWKRTA